MSFSSRQSMTVSTPSMRTVIPQLRSGTPRFSKRAIPPFLQEMYSALSPSPRSASPPPLSLTHGLERSTSSLAPRNRSSRKRGSTLNTFMPFRFLPAKRSLADRLRSMPPSMATPKTVNTACLPSNRCAKIHAQRSCSRTASSISPGLLLRCRSLSWMDTRLRCEDTATKSCLHRLSQCGR